MSWRTGSKLFAEMWPLILANITDREHRIEFTAHLLKQMVRDDMDPVDVEDIHPDVRSAMRQAGIELSDPERYKEEGPNPETKKWWKF
jgi:D-alanyl-D-alanine dipeptidase